MREQWMLHRVQSGRKVLCTFQTNIIALIFPQSKQTFQLPHFSDPPVMIIHTPHSITNRTLQVHPFSQPVLRECYAVQAQ